MTRQDLFSYVTCNTTQNQILIDMHHLTKLNSQIYVTYTFQVSSSISRMFAVIYTSTFKYLLLFVCLNSQHAAHLFM